jgi:hypothetical protein
MQSGRLFFSLPSANVDRMSLYAERLYFSITFLHHRRILSFHFHQPAYPRFLPDWTDKTL